MWQTRLLRKDNNPGFHEIRSERSEAQQHRDAVVAAGTLGPSVDAPDAARKIRSPSGLDG